MTTAPAGETVLVTGGAGFVGSHLVDALVADNEVRVVDDFSTGSRANLPAGVTVFEGDVRDGELVAEAMDGVDLVFHEAAMVSVARSVEEPELSHDVTAGATVRVLDHARRQDARVVLASSAAVYGHPESVPIAETASKNPTSPYGVDKLTADHYARIYNELYDLPTVALRYFNVYGPRQTAGDYSGVISVFVDQATSGEAITVEGDGEQTRDFVHVSDVVAANLSAATTDHVGEAFNVGTGESCTINELAKTIRTVADSDSEITHVEPRQGDVRHSRPDVSKAREKLGYEATTSLADGLSTLLASPTDS